MRVDDALRVDLQFTLHELMEWRNSGIVIVFDKLNKVVLFAKCGEEVGQVAIPVERAPPIKKALARGKGLQIWAVESA